MTLEDAKDVLDYFKLDGYRDGEYFLEEEYYQLEEILKRNEYAKVLDQSKYLWIVGRLSDEEYKSICDNFFNMAKDTLEKKRGNTK